MKNTIENALKFVDDVIEQHPKIFKQREFLAKALFEYAKNIEPINDNQEDATKCRMCGKPHYLLDCEAGNERELARLCIQCFSAKAFNTVKSEPMKEGKSATEILLKVIQANSKECYMVLSDIPDYGDQYGIITINEALQAMQEYRNQGIVLPEIQLFIHNNTNEAIKEAVQVKNIYDNIISEIKRLNGIK